MRGSSRRPAREATLRALYEIEVGRLEGPEAIADTLEHTNLPPDLAEFARAAVAGILGHKSSLDDALSGCLKGWDLPRVAVVDRNVLRLAAYELFHCPSIPPAVTINEAVDLVKKYSTAESGRFVNGVLGELVRRSPKARWDPSADPEEEALALPEPESEPDIETIQADSPEALELTKAGLWKLRHEGPTE